MGDEEIVVLDMLWKFGFNDLYQCHTH